MGWFFSDKHETSVSMNEPNGDQQSSNYEVAEAWLREQSDDQRITALVRHYDIAEVTDHIHSFAGVQINDEETVEIVSKLRREYGVRPLQCHEMPGYISPDEDPEDRKSTRLNS